MSLNKYYQCAKRGVEITPEMYLDHLKEFRDDWNEEFPDRTIRSQWDINGIPMGFDENGSPITPKYKCRKAWFERLIGSIEEGMQSGFVDKQSWSLYRDFIYYIKKTNFGSRLTWKYDVERASEVLTSVISNLERQWGINI